MTCKYHVRIKNNIPELETVPEKEFDTYDDAWVYAMTAVDSASIDHTIRTACSLTLFKGIKHECKITVISIANDGKVRYPIQFQPSQRAMDEYGLKPALLHYDAPVEVPYEVMSFATKKGGIYTSYFIDDEGKPFEESLARKLIDDPMAGVTARGVYFEDGPGVRYDLQYTNPLCSIFRMTPHEPISNAINVGTRFFIESLLAFDDGLVFPFINEHRTHGPFAFNASNAFADIAEVLDGSFDEIKEHLSSSPNYKEIENGFSLIFSSKELGSTWLDFERDDCDMLTSLRCSLISNRVCDIITELD